MCSILFILTAVAAGTMSDVYFVCLLMNVANICVYAIVHVPVLDFFSLFIVSYRTPFVMVS